MSFISELEENDELVEFEETWNEIAKIQAMADIEADMMDEDIRWVDELENN